MQLLRRYHLRLDQIVLAKHDCLRANVIAFIIVGFSGSWAAPLGLLLLLVPLTRLLLELAPAALMARVIGLNTVVSMVTELDD